MGEEGDICSDLFRMFILDSTKRLGIKIVIKEGMLNFRGLLAYVNLIEALFKKKCVIRVSPNFRLVTNNCLDSEYVNYVLAHEACHCVKSPIVLIMIVLLVFSAFLYAFVIPSNIIIDLIVAIILVRFGFFIRLISEYLADSCVLRNYGLGYYNFLKKLKVLESIRGSRYYRVVLKLIGQPTATERIKLLENRWEIIKKFFYL